jgi:hypothetical protein
MDISIPVQLCRKSVARVNYSLSATALLPESVKPSLQTVLAKARKDAGIRRKRQKKMFDRCTLCKDIFMSLKDTRVGFYQGTLPPSG